ncbi:terminase [Aeromonas sanarellii]
MIPVFAPQVSTVETNTSNTKSVTRGRRSAYTNELGEAICSAIADGVSLRAVLARPGMPSKSMVMRWLADERYMAFRDQYARAREDLADKLADEILQIADDGSNDTFLDANGNVKVNHDVIARARLQIDARKWLASKLAPKKYGDGGQRDNLGVNHGSMQVKSIVTFVNPPNWDEDGKVLKDD